MTHPLISATPVKNTIPTAIAPQHNAAGQGSSTRPPAHSIRSEPSTQRTNPAAIATWIGPHQGVCSRTDGFSRKPPAGTG